MKEHLYVIVGRNGAWRINSHYVDNNEVIILVFQNIGSGEYLEVEVCPFEFILRNTEFKKWDS